MGERWTAVKARRPGRCRAGAVRPRCGPATPERFAQQRGQFLWVGEVECGQVGLIGVVGDGHRRGGPAREYRTTASLREAQSKIPTVGEWIVLSRIVSSTTAT